MSPALPGTCWFAGVAMPWCGVTLGRWLGHLLAQDSHQGGTATAQPGPALALWVLMKSCPKHTEFPDRIPTILGLRRAQTQPADKGHWTPSNLM